jgi:putative ABC transport system permease protein
MHLWYGIMISLEALWAHKLRTILTLQGNIVGVMSIMAIVSLIDSSNTYIETELIGMGSGCIPLIAHPS